MQWHAVTTIELHDKSIDLPEAMSRRKVNTVSNWNDFLSKSRGILTSKNMPIKKWNVTKMRTTINFLADFVTVIRPTVRIRCHLLPSHWLLWQACNCNEKSDKKSSFMWKTKGESTAPVSNRPPDTTMESVTVQRQRTSVHRMILYQALSIYFVYSYECQADGTFRMKLSDKTLELLWLYERFN